MFGNRNKLAQQLQAQGGTVAWATILGTSGGWASASMDGFNRVQSETDHERVNLRVEPEGEQPFEASFRQAFKDQMPRQGWTCKVIYDPQDHSKIAVLDGTITPAGLDHDRAERAIARRAELKEAARTGNIAEYVEKRKAEALSGQSSGIVMVNGQVVSGGDLMSALAAKAAQAGQPAPAQPPVAQPSAAQPDLAGQLAKLGELRDKGILTDAEFQAAKAKILSAG
jgi:hypothetical protein